MCEVMVAKGKTVCVYCGSSSGNSDQYLQAANTLGKMIGIHGLDLVYGGGDTGLMGAVAKSAMENGAHVTGIIPKFLVERERPDTDFNLLGEAIVTDDMHERKHKMFERADAFVTLPGGIGTLEEIVEIMTWAQLGRHSKPMVLANIDNFWSPLQALLAHMKDAGFLHSADLIKPLVIDNAEEIVPALEQAFIQQGA